MALFDRLAKRIEQRAAEVAERTRTAVETAWMKLPDMVVRREGDALILSGRGLMRRRLGDARLRFAIWSRR